MRLSLNPWGRELEPQRSDLWEVNLEPLIREFESRGGSYGLNGKTTFYASAVTLPELAITPDIIYRDSRPYNMPGLDSQLSPARITFTHDVSSTAENDVRCSKIYRLLNAWRSIVRSGRGGMSTESVPTLGQNFKPPLEWQFNLNLQFLQGGRQDAEDAAVGDPNLGAGLQVASVYVLVNAWLGGIRLTDVSYESPVVHKIEATLYIDDVLQIDPAGRRQLSQL
jgi:hypothetical protein